MVEIIKIDWDKVETSSEGTFVVNARENEDTFVFGGPILFSKDDLETRVSQDPEYLKGCFFSDDEHGLMFWHKSKPNVDTSAFNDAVEQLDVSVLG